MQHQITKSTPLLDSNGHLTEPGWATKPYWQYDRAKIKAPWYRRKEWDYYAVLSHDGQYGITFTISDLGYLGLAAICWLDFERKKFWQQDSLFPLPMGKLNFPLTSESGSVEFADKKMSLLFAVEGDKRIITFAAPNFRTTRGQIGLAGSLCLQQNEAQNGLAIATSWAENRRAFYYNHKVNCMPAQGQLRLGTKDYTFEPASASGVLDWGRGVWTFKNRWFWGSASGRLKGEPFGFNIGYGFSDRSPASENIVYYQNQAHKLDQVQFHFDPSDYCKPWRFSSNDGRFELEFEPLVDRRANTNLLLVKSVQHQVFGWFSGRVKLDDGSEIQVQRLLGFAEDVLNWL